MNSSEPIARDNRHQLCRSQLPQQDVILKAMLTTGCKNWVWIVPSKNPGRVFQIDSLILLDLRKTQKSPKRLVHSKSNELDKSGTATFVPGLTRNLKSWS